MKLGVLSNDNLNRGVHWTTLGPPLLNPLASNADCEFVAPPPLEKKNIREWYRIARTMRSVNTLFWMQAASRPEFPVLVASILGGNSRRSAVVVDAWKHLILKIGTVATIQKLNPCFVFFREGYEDLKRRFPLGRFEWLPFGVDTDVFDSMPGERPIFAYWMGRRHEPLHQAMLQYCAARGLEYRFTIKGGEFSNPRDLGQLVGSSKYFFVAPPDLADPRRTGGYSPFVMRYLEGLSAGARLIGVLPGSGEYQRLLPMDAILQVAADGSDLSEKLDADSNRPEVWSGVEQARLYVRSNHSWSRRAQQIYDRLNGDTPTGFDQS